MKTPYFRKTAMPVLFIAVLFLLNSCKKSSSTTTDATTAPTVTTAGLIINLTSTTAQSGGTVSSPGSSVVTANGVCYSATNATPTINDSKTSETVSSSGYFPVNFVSNLTGLTAGTKYYLRAYASNSDGTAYGSVVEFTTSTGISAIVTTVGTFAGSATAGYADGTGVNALFNNPQGITVDASGNIYVSDSYNHRIRKVTASGVVSTFAGNGTIGYADGDATAAEFYGPHGLVADKAGNIYVADFGNNVIRKITPAGVVSTFVGNGTAGFVNGTGTSCEFNNPSGLAIDASENLYVADRGNNSIRKITPAGVVTTLAGVKSPGYVNDTGTAALFNDPNGVAVDAAGNVYVADQGNSAIRKITSAGVVTTIAGGPTQTDLVNLPSGLALDKDGNIYITDESGRIMECTTANVLYILAGTLNSPGFVNGVGTSALFNNPQAIAVDANNNIYVADQNNNCIRKLTVKITP
ncbi:MAG: NHL repeat-containing protein [Mucilaginibacter sp.]